MYLNNPGFSSLVLDLCPDNTQWPCVTLGRTNGTTLTALLYSTPLPPCFLLSHPEPLKRQYQYLSTNDILGQSPVAAAAALQASPREHARNRGTEDGGTGDGARNARRVLRRNMRIQPTQTTTTTLDRAHEQGSQVAASMLEEGNDAPTTDWTRLDWT